MEKYIALLRGGNVGGKNKISMSELKVVFERYGYADVKTYLYIGNILFRSEKVNEEESKRTAKHCRE